MRESMECLQSLGVRDVRPQMPAELRQTIKHLVSIAPGTIGDFKGQHSIAIAVESTPNPASCTLGLKCSQLKALDPEPS